MYEGRCLLCEEVGVTTRYIGETLRTIAERNTEHLEDCLKREELSHIREHASKCHPESMEDILSMFQMRSLRRAKKPMNRQVREAVELQQDNSKTLLNKKEEFSRCILPTIVALGPPARPV